MRRSRLDFDRQERLLQEQLASQAEYDAAKAAYDASRAQVDQASAALRQAQTDLEYTRILSPIDGVVVDRKYDVGQTVAASFQAPTLFTIAQDLTKMQVLADVDQSDIGRIRVGQTARFTVDAYPEEEFQGTIAQIRLNATVSQNVITYPVILMVENAAEKLRPLMTANVSIEVAQVQDVLRAPNAALRFRPTDAERGAGTDRRPGGSAPGAGADAAPRRGAGGFAAAAGARERAGARPEGGGRPQVVYVLDPAGAPKRVSVRAGISDGRFTQILDGEIGPGDRVIVGQATARVEGAARPPGMGGGGRFF
jgi:HlyD family secretion protein